MKWINRASSGLALVELLIYLSMVVLLSNLLFGYYARTQTMIRNAHQQGLRTMQWYAVMDLIKHEVRKAPGKYSYWQVTEPKRLVWQDYEGRSYGFEAHDNKLYKIIGSYEPISQHWTHVRKLVLLEQVSLLFEYEWVTVGNYSMLQAITLINQKDQTRLRIVLANKAYVVRHG